MDDLDKDFLSQKFKSVSHLFSYITLRYGRSSSTPVHVFVIIPAKGVSVQKVNEVATKRSLIFRTKELDKNFYRITIGVKIRLIEGFLITTDEWWILISRGQGGVVRKVVIDSFVKNHFFSVLTPAYLEPIEMIEIINGLNSVYDRIVLDEFSMASERSSLREWLMSGEIFTDELCTKLQESYNSSFTGLRISGLSNDSDSCKIRIYSESRLCFLSGSFSDFYQFIIVPYLRRSLEVNRKYQNRERKVEDGKVSLFGVTIEGKTQFSTEELSSIRSFIQKDYYSGLIYENPIVILQASDRRDGSSFDVYITEQSIRIIPLTRASSGSLIELCTSIVRRLPPFISFRPTPVIETECI
ncbi:MAG: hypothetical protein ACTSV2_19135 [Candidatus Thorarchaeota archaeon]